MAQAAELYAAGTRDWAEAFIHALHFGTPPKGQDHVTVAQARAQADSEVNLTLHRVAYETAHVQANLEIALLASGALHAARDLQQGLLDADQSDT